MVEDSTPAAATCSSTPALTACKTCSVLQAKITECEYLMSVMRGTTLAVIVLFCA